MVAVSGGGSGGRGDAGGEGGGASMYNLSYCNGKQWLLVVAACSTQHTAYTHFVVDVALATVDHAHIAQLEWNHLVVENVRGVGACGRWCDRRTKSGQNF